MVDGLAKHENTTLAFQASLLKKIDENMKAKDQVYQKIMCFMNMTWHIISINAIINLQSEYRVIYTYFQIQKSETRFGTRLKTPRFP